MLKTVAALPDDLSEDSGTHMVGRRTPPPHAYCSMRASTQVHVLKEIHVGGKQQEELARLRRQTTRWLLSVSCTLGDGVMLSGAHGSISSVSSC